MVVVAEGAFGPELRWVIDAEGTDEEFSTMLTVHHGDRIVGSGGMAGPKLWGDDLVNSSYGVSNDQPCIEVIRADPSVDRVIVVTDGGYEAEAELTATSPEFGLRFGAMQLPDGQFPVELRPESSGTVVYRESQGGLNFDPPTAVSEDGLFYGGGPA